MAAPESLDITYSGLGRTRWEEYRNLRMEALLTDPEAFGSDYVEELKLGKDVWENRIGNVIFAFSGQKPVGMIGHILIKRNKQAHIADIVGFYVKSEYRGMGIGKGLIGGTIRIISENRHIRKIKLFVNSTQAEAVSLYHKFGFEVVGTLKDEILVNGRFLDQIIMEKFILQKI